MTSQLQPIMMNTSKPMMMTQLKTFKLQSFISEWMEQQATWLIKRTFQPSLIRKRRKTGFLTRQKSVGGRRVLKRRLLKGRARLGGC